jgi:peptide/nickel transport system substrate-binding protein
MERVHSLTSEHISRRNILRVGALLGGGIAASALLGCGSDDDNGTANPSGTAGSAGGTQVAQLPGYDVAGHRVPYNFPETHQPRDGGTVVIGTTWEPSTFDTTKSASGGTITVPNTAMVRLMHYDQGPDADPNKLKIMPEAGTSWETSSDGLTYTWKIRPGLKWHNLPPVNGRPFVAADVKFAYERYKAGGVNTQYFTNVASFEAPDDQTLKITLNKPQPDFLIPLASRYLTIFSHEVVDSGQADKTVIGAGPFVIKEVTSGGVSFTKNPDYWEGPLHVDGLEYRSILDPAAQLAAFRAGQIDYGYTVGTTFTDLETLLKTNPNTQAVAVDPQSNGFSFMFNLDKPKYQDERVRRAVSLAMDRKQLIDVVMAGYGKSLPTMPWIFLFDEEPTPESGLLGKWWKTDMAQAKQLLQAAGQENMDMPMNWYNYNDVWNARQEDILVDQLRQAGINLKPQKTDYTEFNSQLNGHTFEDTLDGWAAAGVDADNYFYAQLKSGSPANRFRINDKQLDEWAEQQRVELDEDARKAIWRKMWDYELDKMYHVERPTNITFQTYQPWLRGVRWVAPLGGSSFYYDWAIQAKGLFLEK